MSMANLLSALLAAVVLGLVAMHLAGGGRRRDDPPDDTTSRRRTWVAWEIRAVVIGTAGPCAAGIFFSYLSPDYTLPLLLFTAAGFLAADLVAPADEHAHR